MITRYILSSIKSYFYLLKTFSSAENSSHVSCPVAVSLQFECYQMISDL